ncbi:MAG: ATP-binding cassette domain-containing protein, partial [Actinomycetota bacterium]
MTSLLVDVRVAVPGFAVVAKFAADLGVTVLAGPSGSGKSLTLAAVSGTLRPMRGTIQLDDIVYCDAARDVHLRSQDRLLGMAYQHAALLDHRSPLDNVALAVRSGDTATRRTVAMETLQRVGAESLAEARTRSLSGG